MYFKTYLKIAHNSISFILRWIAFELFYIRNKFLNFTKFIFIWEIVPCNKFIFIFLFVNVEISSVSVNHVANKIDWLIFWISTWSCTTNWTHDLLFFIISVNFSISSAIMAQLIIFKNMVYKSIISFIDQLFSKWALIFFLKKWFLNNF